MPRTYDLHKFKEDNNNEVNNNDVINFKDSTMMLKEKVTPIADPSEEGCLDVNNL